MMTDNGWDNFGQQILDRVDDAIRYGDFSNLSRSVGNIINETIDAVRGQGGAYRQGSGPRYGNGGWQDPGYANRERQNQYRENAAYRGGQSAQPVLYNQYPGGRVLGILMCVGGVLAALIFGVLFLAVALTSFGDPLVIAIAAFFAAFFAVLTALSVALAVAGTRKIRFLGRYQSYVRMLRQRVNVPIRELADRVGKSIDYTVRDLQKMIDKRLFYQAHIDRVQNYLILTDEAYNEYRAAQNEYAAQEQQREREQAQQTKKEQAAKEADENLPLECRALIEKGQSYIRHIHESNEAIPGEEISAKLDYMERVVTRIFDVVRAHPEVAPDLNKLMSYYLPTTQKLLDAYRELDSQPASGEHISSTKREIEETIDTLNVAFEKLLDSLFEDQAWDISSDISVLHTILAQDGLKEDELKSKA
ncbi:MAG: 5-bromo-4-chloroindolyl phosphate hydrolysis family protein [Clostridiales bacterium]|nr:5-bromo-4-chloroindolyl phosphate hydrolysis family protein [Clostridiales bacterium]